MSYRVVWEYRVADEQRAEFERNYGADGLWAEFFGRSDGYLRTELLRDVDDPSRYVTVDHWRSKEDYESFRLHEADEYQRIDDAMSALTIAEQEI